MKMKKWMMVLLALVWIVAVFLVIRLNEEHTENEVVLVANPASEYCVQQGYSVDIRDETDGQVGYCISSDGQECEEWTFYRGECSFEGQNLCVKASCCHATSCVLESEAPNCSEVMCTMECAGETLDCGAGHCAFVDGNCEAVWDEE
jgi:putative hemolysin